MTWARFWRGTGESVRVGWPRWLVVIGFLAVLPVVFTLPGDIATLRQNTDLHERGRTVSAVVVAVEEQHHTGHRGGSWTEYWPVTRQTIDGVTSTTPLRGYASTARERYQRGQRLTVLIDPDDRRTIALAGAGARASLQRQVRIGAVVGATGAVFLAIGVPVAVRRAHAHRRRTALAKPLGTAREWWRSRPRG
ncbi:hypothetical protein DEJ16_00120 [Curtobacterium sp. MCJR17_055]|nr:hypothetical protein DEI87_09775 [Curtobacterium sp. MCBD17_029]PYY57520.1 hypothetical protein DEJ26_11315 [Curtobacterium sp. MCPF17_015]PYY58176.1 hypothetical protein DEJ16_00120 [Curtobacterium sp. MCJR17_055]PZE93497.1 hypothetical protein DEI95_07145 [Curtobacterium sp. MCBD17_008]